MFLVPDIYSDNPQNSGHYPIKITVEKRNEFSDFLRVKLEEIK